MLYRVKLKNAEDHVLLDSNVYEYLVSDPYLVKINFIDNLRRHSSGCAVFQKTWRARIPSLIAWFFKKPGTRASLV